MEQTIQTEINDRVALAMGRQLIELIAAQTTIAALQAALQKATAKEPSA